VFNLANFIYKKAKQAILNGQINISANQYKVLFLKNSLYTPNQNLDEFVSDIPSSAIAERSSNIPNITNTLGVIDGDDIIIDNYNGGTFEAIAFYQVGSSDSSSRLIFYIDTSEGLPYVVTANNTTVTILWSNEINKILAI